MCNFSSSYAKIPFPYLETVWHTAEAHAQFKVLVADAAASATNVKFRSKGCWIPLNYAETTTRHTTGAHAQFKVSVADAATMAIVYSLDYAP